MSQITEMGTARARFRGCAVFLFFNGNFEGFDGADNGDARWFGSGMSLEGADNGGPRIRDSQEGGGGAAPIGQLQHRAP